MTGEIDSTYFTRFERVTNVTQTRHGTLADVDGELLRVDVLRDDVLRVKVSRGQIFDEAPTFAVHPISMRRRRCSQSKKVQMRCASRPQWALDYHQCRWFEYTQKSVEHLCMRVAER